ncbi:LOW QUALITY PROTEIN: hypothetical protein CFOL_v3_06224, partial [Cephalotus follicularis]
INPDTITPAKVKHMYASSTTSCSGEHLPTHFIAGRITINMKATKATPDNNTHKDINGLLCSSPTMATPMPQIKGREIPAKAMPNACLLLRRMELKSSSRPTRKRKKRRPILATDSSIGVLHCGNIACKFWFLPRADGPSRIPP